MTSPDEFYRMTLRSLYQRSDHIGLNAIEMAALLPLKMEWESHGSLDRFWARVPVLQEDGTARMETLTIARVESYANVYRARYFSIEASMEPDAASQQEEA